MCVARAALYLQSDGIWPRWLSMHLVSAYVQILSSTWWFVHSGRHQKPKQLLCCIIMWTLLHHAGQDPFIVQQGIARLVSDIPGGISQQYTMADCGRACYDHKGPPRCVAWAYSSPWNSTAGTCWLKAVPDHTMHTARSVVSAALAGKSYSGCQAGRRVPIVYANNALLVALGHCACVCARLPAQNGSYLERDLAAVLGCADIVAVS